MTALTSRSMFAQFLCIWILFASIPATPAGALTIAPSGSANLRPDAGAICINTQLAKGESQRLPETFYLQDGKTLLRLSVGEMWEGAPAVANKNGSFTVTMEQANISLPIIATKAQEDGMFVVLGSDIDFENPSFQISKSLGFNIDELYFEETMSMTREADFFGMTTEYIAGADRFSITVPWAQGKSSSVQPAQIAIDINGRSISLAAETLANLGQASAKASWDTAELSNVFDALADPDAFTASYLRQAQALYSVFNSSSVKCAGCWLSCGGCVLSLLGYGLSIPALIAACVGSLGLTCVLTLVAHEVEAAAIILSCTSCFDCLS